MSILRSTPLVLAAMALPLVIGGCNGKDKGAERVISGDTQSISFSAPSDKAFARHFAVPKRKIDTAQSEKALAQLGLAESDSAGLSWTKRSGKAGSYSYTNLSSKTEDGMVTIGRAELIGVRMEGELATFDIGNFSDVVIDDEGTKLTIDTMRFARPTPDTSRAIIKSLADMSDNLDIDLGDDQNFGFGALSAEDITIASAEMNGTIKEIIWGEDEDTKLTDFKIENVDVNITGNKNDGAAKLTLRRASGLDFKKAPGGMAGLSSMGAGQSGLVSLLGRMNVYDAPYKSFGVEGLSFTSGAMDIDVPSLKGASKTKGDVTTISQVLDAVTIDLKDQPNDRNARQVYGWMKELGFDTLKFNSTQTTVLDKGQDSVRVKDAAFVMEDGFRLNYTYGASGLAAMQAAANAQTGTDAMKTSAAMDKVLIDDIRISLEDNSIVERGMKFAAKMRGSSEERVRKELKAALTLAPLMAGSDLEKDIIKEAGSAFLDFIKDGGTMTVQIDPPTPLSFKTLSGAQKNKLSPDAIGFSAQQEN